VGISKKRAVGFLDGDVDRAQPGAVHAREGLEVGAGIDHGDVHLHPQRLGFFDGPGHGGAGLLQCDVFHRGASFVVRGLRA
jgi:hypothetical protein